MNDLRPSEIIYIEDVVLDTDDVLDTNDVKRTVALRIIEQHGWVGTASFDAELGVHSHYSIEDVRDFLGY
jgi:hypothetical protein